jgi:predicted nucleic acid-binding protein
MASSGLVVDASVASKWYLRDEDLVSQADALLSDWRVGRWDLVAPGHYPFEVTGAILRAGRTGRLTESEVHTALAHFAELLQRLALFHPNSS